MILNQIGIPSLVLLEVLGYVNFVIKRGTLLLKYFMHSI